MATPRRVQFTFDARSLVSLDTLQQQGCPFAVLAVGEHTLVLPQTSAPHFCTPRRAAAASSAATARPRMV